MRTATPPRSPWCASSTDKAAYIVPTVTGKNKAGDETMKSNFLDGPDIPLGFGMALAQNPDAMDVFSGLTPAQRQQVLEKTHRIRSKAEMRSYVDSLVGLDPTQLG